MKYGNENTFSHLISNLKHFFDKKADLKDNGMVKDDQLPIVEINYEDYLKIPVSERSKNNITYFITDLDGGEGGSSSGGGSGNPQDHAELLDLRIGIDGTEYSSAGESVRTQIQNLQDQINNMPQGSRKETDVLSFSSDANNRVRIIENIGIVQGDGTNLTSMLSEELPNTQGNEIQY